MSECAGNGCAHPGCQGAPDRYMDSGVIRDRLLEVPAMKWDLMNRKKRRELARKGYHRAG